MLDIDPVYNSLASTDQERRRRYRAFLKEGVSMSEKQFIDKSVNRNQLTGSHLFVDEIEQRIGLRVERRGRGRPGNEEKYMRPLFAGGSMSRYLPIILGWMLLLPSMGYAASYDCAKAKTEIEKLICKFVDLSHLDDQMGLLYRRARAKTVDSDRLKREQRQWLNERNKCEHVRCIKASYEARMAELRQGTDMPFDPKAWVADRERQIKEVLADKELYIPERVPSSTPFCHKLLEDVKTLAGMKIIAPVVIADGLDSPNVKRLIMDRCPTLYIGEAFEVPRKIVLYNVDIDNEPANGKEWLLGDHYIKRISPRWGEELLVKNRYTLIDMSDCEESIGTAYVGASQRYGPLTDPVNATLDTGLHGVLRYRGKFYIYDVNDEPKVTPFGIQEYFRAEKDSKSKCYFHERLQ